MSSIPNPPQILAVNDSPDVLAFFREFLEEEGYRVTTQAPGTRDFDRIVQHTPDVIVLDAMWLTEADWTLLQRLATDPQTRAIPVVLCTVPVMRVDSLHARLDGLRVHLVPKPYTLDDVLVAVAAALADAA